MKGKCVPLRSRIPSPAFLLKLKQDITMDQKITGFIAVAVATVLTGLIYTYRLGGDNYVFLTDVLAVIFSLAAIVVGILTMHLYGGLKTLHGKALFYFILGISSWFLAELIWLTFDGSAVYVSETLRILGYIPIALGFHTSLRISDVKFKYTRKKVFTIFIMFMIFAIIYLNVIPITLNPASFLSNLLSNGYIIADFVLLFGMFSLVKVSFSFKKGYLSYGWIFMAIAFTCVFIFNVYFALFPFAFGDTIEIFWLASYIFLAYGFFYLRYSLVELKKRI